MSFSAIETIRSHLLENGKQNKAVNPKRFTVRHNKNPLQDYESKESPGLRAAKTLGILKHKRLKWLEFNYAWTIEKSHKTLRS